MAQISYGTITITDTTDIERIYVVYAKSTSNTVAPSAAASNWTENINSAPGTGQYIWQRTVVLKSGGTSSTNPSYGNPVCVTGPEGGIGPQGVGVSSVETQYGTSINTTTQPTNWYNSAPVYNENTPIYWIKTVTHFSDGSSSQPIIRVEQGITDATGLAADADNKANEANINSHTALSIANDTHQHFWALESDYVVPSSNPQIVLPAGVYVTQVKINDDLDTGFIGFKNNPRQGNILTRSDGIYLRTGNQTLTSLTTSAFTIYNPANDSIPMMGLTSTGLTFYTAAGAAIGSFGSDNIGGLLDLSGRLNIRGGGRIGQDSINYWEFGESAAYNTSQAAYLLGKGNSSIQLGENGHWRLDKNRIHTGWYELNSTPAGALHFDTHNENRSSSVSGNQYYWDYGLHFPFSNQTPSNDKFLYIRRSTTTVANTPLDTLKNRIDNDSYWVYPFYVDDLGRVHAQNFYIGESEIPIGGGAGTVAEKLMSGAGSATQPVYFPTSGENQGKPVAISYTIAKSVPSNAVFTDTKNTTGSTDSSEKLFIVGATEQSANPQTYSQDTAYIGTNGHLYSNNKQVVNLSDSQALTNKTYNGYTLAAASAKGVDTSIAAASTSTNLPTSAAVAAFVEGKGYIDIDTTYALVQNSTDGHIISLVPSNGEGQTITIPDNNTTYTFANGTNGFTVTPSDGSAQTVTVTPSITNNVTGSGTNNYLTKWSGTNTITNGPALGSDASKFLNNKGEWAVPGGTFSLTTATYTALGGVKPWYSTTGTSSGPTASTYSSNVTVNSRSTNSGRYYAIEIDSNGRLFVNVPWTNVNSSYLTGITSNDVTTALGYTPYNSTNPAGYTTNVGTVTSVKVQGNNGLTGSGTVTSSGTITISHATGTGTSSSNTGRTYIQSVELDEYGHVTSLSTATETVTDTHYQAQNITTNSSSSKTQTSVALTNGNVYLNLIENNAVRSTHKISGSGTTSVTTDETGNIIISSADSKTGTVTSVRVQATAPVVSSSSSAQTSSLNTTISLADGYGDTKNPYGTKTPNYVLAGPSSGTTAAVPSFRALVAADIPNLAWSKITSGNDDLKAIESLTGTSGFLKKTAANTWSLDNSTYVPTSRKVNGHALTSDVTVTKSDVGLGNVLNYSQVTGIGQGAGGTLRVWTGDPTSTDPNDYEDIQITITAYDQSTVAKASALDLSAAVGSTTNPVYFKTDGKPYPITDGTNPITIAKSVPANAVFTDTTYSFADSYNASTNKGATVATVTNAINALDGGSIGTPGVGKTITALSQTNGNISATFGNISITASQISDFASAVANTTAQPASHIHGNIQNDGTLQANDITIANNDQLVVTDASDSNKIARTSIKFDGSTTTQALTKAGTWQTFNNYSLPLAANGTRGGVQIGYSESGTNYAVKLSSEKMYVTVPWTDEKLKWTASTSTNTYYPLASTSTATTGNANTLNSISYYQYYNTAGGYRRLILGNTTAYTTSGGAYGTIRLYGTGATYYGDLNPGVVGTNSLTANRTWSLPDETGTLIVGAFDYSTSGNNRAVQKDSNGNLYVVQKDTDTNTTYALSGAVSSHKFTATLTAGGSGSGTSTASFTLAAGNNISLTDNGTTITIASTDTNTDTKVTQAYSTTNSSYPLLMTATAGISSTSSRGDTTAILTNSIYANPYNGTITANTFSGALNGTATGNITSVQYDSTNSKITYTKNGTNTDIVTITNLKTYLGLAAAAYKGVVTTVDTSANLPTANAVKTFVEGKGYVTSSGVTSIATSSPITGGTITGSGTIGHATSGVGSAVTTAGLYKFKYDTYGHVTGVTAVAKADITGLGIPGSDTNTKNTAGSTDTSSEIYLIGATSQAANPQTYSHDTARIRANGNFVGSGYEMALSNAMGTTKAKMEYKSDVDAIVFTFV